MPNFDTIIGEKALCFADFVEFDRAVDEYDISLRVHITNEQGEEVIQLIGIDGKPTTDEGLFASRQRVMEILRSLKMEYCSSGYDGTDYTLLGFYNRNAIVEGTFMSRYMRLDDFYQAYKKSFMDAWQTLASFYEEYKSRRELAIARNMQLCIESLFSKIQSMKNIIEQMISCSNNIKALNICNRFIEKGLGIFDDEFLFRDNSKVHLEELQSECQDLLKKLEHNANSDNYLNMIF